MIDSIHISPEFEKYKVQITESHIQNLSKINVFIGENNSGKSRFLRNLFNRNDYYVTDSMIDMSKIISLFEICLNKVQYQIHRFGIQDLTLRYGSENSLLKIFNDDRRNN